MTYLPLAHSTSAYVTVVASSLLPKLQWNPQRNWVTYCPDTHQLKAVEVVHHGILAGQKAIDNHE